MIDYVAAVERESARFASVLDRSLRRSVPSCPGWTTADLIWHLAEVQQFWAAIAGGLLTSPDQVQKIDRPVADDALPELFRVQSAALVAALRERDATDRCWSWDPAGGTVGWVRRRQAHEALIHRIDAELGAGAPHATIDPILASDGVDEILTVMMSGVPEWGTFTPDGTIVTILAVDTDDAWTAMMGRFTGTSPNSGRTYDEDALDLIEQDSPADSEVVASAGDLDLWLWGRGDRSERRVDGDPAVLTRLRTIAAAATG